MPRPFTIEMTPGEKQYLCTCEKSSKLPFCDGSHRGLGKTPLVINFTEDSRVLISGTTCGQASNDGHSHGGGCCRSKTDEDNTPKHGGGCCHH